MITRIRWQLAPLPVRSGAKNYRSVIVYSQIMNGAMQEYNILPVDLLLYEKSLYNSISRT